MCLQTRGTAIYPPVTTRNQDRFACGHLPEHSLREGPDMTATARSGAAALPVRPGEKPWTEVELAKVRQELDAEVAGLRADRSEERRVGKECRSRGWPYH